MHRHSSRASFLLLIISIFIVTSSSSFAEPKRPDKFENKDYVQAIEYLLEFAEYQRDEFDIPGLSFALIDGENIIWQGGLGYANEDAEISANESTLYRTGALSTIITAALIVQLEWQGKLKLSDPLTKYFPEFSFSNQTDIPTIKQLLTHHAGFPLSVFQGMWTEESPEPLKQLAESLNGIAASYPPDKIFAYSNLGYDLLGRIIEIIENKSFAEVAEEKLFKPLGMTNSTFNWQKIDKAKLAAGYKDGDLKPFLQVRDTPALGLVSNVSELVKLVQTFLGVQPKPEQTMPSSFWNKLIDAHNKHIKLDLNKGIGFGWQIGGMEINTDYKVVWRQGSTLLHRSRIAMIPEHDIGVVVMANSSKGFRALEEISKESLGVLLELKLGKTQASESDEQQLPSLSGSQSDFKPLYSSYVGLIKAEKEEKSILLDVMGWELTLKPDADGWYRVEYDLLGFIPLKLDWFEKIRVTAINIDGLDVAVIHHSGVNYLFAWALKHEKVSPIWLQRAGVYEPKSRDALLNHFEVKTGELKLHENVLVFEYKLPGFLPMKFRLPVIPLSDTDAIIPGLGTGLNERITVGKNESGEFLQYSRYQLIEKK